MVASQPPTAFRLLDAVQVFHQSQPGRLLELGYVGRGEPITSSGGGDHATKTAYQLLPGSRVTLSSSLDQKGH